jgi:flagellar protein FliO/FliZ
MNAQPEMLPSLLKMIASLGIVLGGLLLTLWLVRRFVQSRSGRFNGQLIRVLASSTVGLKKNIALVEVPGQVLVLGMTGDRISLLSKIEDPESIRRIRGDATAKPAIPFAEHLHFFSSKFKGSHDSR